MQWKCTELICFEWQCNLFEIVQVLQTWELRLFYRKSFVGELCEIHPFPVATNLKIINWKIYISNLEAQFYREQDPISICTLCCLLYPACFNKWKVNYGIGSLCRESSCDASVASEEVADFRTGVVSMQLLLAVEARQPIYSCKTINIPVPYSCKQGILTQSLTFFICISRLFRDHQCTKRMWLWRQCQGGTVEI